MDVLVENSEGLSLYSAVRFAVISAGAFAIRTASLTAALYAAQVLSTAYPVLNGYASLVPETCTASDSQQTCIVNTRPFGDVEVHGCLQHNITIVVNNYIRPH